MKRFLAIVLLTWYFMASVAFAYGYPRFWKGDTNYPLVYGKKDYAFYLDKNSIKIKLNDPPYYIITARTITVYSYRDYAPGNEKYSNDREATGTDSYELFYDEKEMDMRVKDSKTSVWRYLRPQSDYIMQGQSMYVGEAVFYVVTRRKFYGNYLWKGIGEMQDKPYKDEQGNDEYWDPFDDMIYKDL